MHVRLCFVLFAYVYHACLWIHIFLPYFSAILADDIFKYIFMNEKCCIFNQLSLEFVPRNQINNITTLVRVTTLLFTDEYMFDNRHSVLMSEGLL